MEIRDKARKEIRYYGELMYVKFDKPYCDLFFTKKRKYTVESTLKHLMDKLPEAAFLICKRSAVINLCYIRVIDRNPPMVEMEDVAILELSDKNLKDLERMRSRLNDIAPPCPICYPCKEHSCESQMLFCKRKNIWHSSEPEME